MKRIVKALGPYNKVVVALVGVILTSAYMYYSDSKLSTDELQYVVLLFASALGVYAIPNRQRSN